MKGLKTMLALAAFGAVGVVQGEDNYWIGPSGGTFTEPTNWSLGIAPTSGQTLYVTNGPSCVNPFATGTTGINTTLDLGGATQTLTADPDDIFGNGAKIVNGKLLLPPNPKVSWANDGKTVTFGTNLVMTCAIRLYHNGKSGKGGAATLNFQDGCEASFTSTESDHLLSGASCSKFYINVLSKAKVSFAHNVLHIGAGNGGWAQVTVDDATLISEGCLELANRWSGDYNGTGYLIVKNNGFVGCEAVTVAKSDYKNAYGEISVDHGTIRAEGIYLMTTNNNNKASCTLNGALLIPTTAGIDFFQNIAPTVNADGLTISNSVGNVKFMTAITGRGGLTLAGTGTNTFTVAPTYMDATTVKDGATLAYTKDLTLAAATFEPGAILSMPVTVADSAATAPVLTVSGEVSVDDVVLAPTGVSDWSGVSVKLLTATEITGAPVIAQGLKTSVVDNGDGTVSLWLMEIPEAEKPMTAVYKGDGTVADYIKSKNWTCYTADGTVVAGITPASYTTVNLAGETAFAYSAATAETFKLAGVAVTDDVTLAADCDWSGFTTLSIAETKTINLNGHTLAAPLTAAQTAQVTGSGVITIDVPEDTTETIAAADWGFVKTGAGELKVRLTADHTAVGSMVTLAAGALTLVNEAGTAVTNAIPTTTTGIAGTLDLGGTTQEFTADPDDIFGNGAKIVNGELLLPSNSKVSWANDGKTVTFGTNLVMTCAIRLYHNGDYGKGGDATLNFQDGCEASFTWEGSDHLLSGKDCSPFDLNVFSKANVRFKEDVRIGAGSGGLAKVTVDDATLISEKHLMLANHWSSNDNNGTGYLIVTNGGFVDCEAVTVAESTDKAKAYGEISVDRGTIRAQKIWLMTTNNNNKASCTLNGAVLIPTTAEIDFFKNITPTIGEGGLTISNAVGNVNYTTEITGAGGLTLTGEGTNTFAVASTYKGATTLTNGTTFAYVNDQTLSAATFEPGTTLAMDVEVVDAEAKAAELTVAGDVSVDGVILAPTGLASWNDVDVKILTATNITGTAVVPAGLKTDIVANEAAGNVELWLMDKNYLPPAKRPVTAFYKGDGDTEGYTNAANWVCWNADGAVIEGMVPRYYTTVQLAGETVFTYPAALADTFPVAGIEVTSNVTLTADCDWKTLGAFPIAEDAWIALNGHRLDAALTVAQTAKVTGGGTLVFDIPASTTETITAADWGFVKTGAGELKVRLTADHTAVGSMVTLAAGALTLVNEAGTAVTNAIPTTTTGIAGTLDLGGTVQTLTADPDDIFGNGAKIVNGELLLPSNSKVSWANDGKTVTFGTNLVMTCAIRLYHNGDYGKGGDATLNFQDGCEASFTWEGSNHLFSGDSCSKFYLNVFSKANVRFKEDVRIGAGSGGWAKVTVDDATLMSEKHLMLANRWSGSGNGTGCLIVTNGGFVDSEAVTVAESGSYKNAYGEISVDRGTIRAQKIWLMTTNNNNKASCTLNGAVLIPTTAGIDFFKNITPTIGESGLMISNAVGTVNYTTEITGEGGLTFTGGGMNVFTAAPTYTGATTVTDGTLDLGGLDHGSTSLVVGAKGRYVANAAYANAWGTIAFEEGSSVVRTEKTLETKRMDSVITANSITGLPDAGGRYLVKAEETGGVVTKLTLVFKGGFMLLLR